jgi:hypothetical protein
VAAFLTEARAVVRGDAPGAWPRENSHDEAVRVRGHSW